MRRRLRSLSPSPSSPVSFRCSCYRCCSALLLLHHPSCSIFLKLPNNDSAAEAVESMLEELLPHRLTEYLYDLASEWLFDCGAQFCTSCALVQALFRQLATSPKPVRPGQ